MMAAHMLSAEFCQRGMFFYSIWVDKGSPPDMIYTAADISSYAEDLEWVTWLTEQELESVQFDAGLEVRKTGPRV